MYKIIVITPVYEDREAASRLFKELGRLYGEQCQVIAVDDGSVRQPVSCDWISQAGLHGTVLRLKRNVGHQRAIAAGVAYVAKFAQEDDRVVIMDSDGEDTPESIRFLLDRLAQGELDMVVATRLSRVETWRFKAFYQVYRWLFRLMSGRELAFGNFMALKPSAVRRLSAMSELGIHVAASALNSKLRLAHLPLDRGPRYAGQSKMNFVGLALHGFKAMMVFSEDILVRAGMVCAGVAALAVLGAVVAVGLKVFGYATPGWFSVVVGVLFLVFLQTGATTLMSLMLAGTIRLAAQNAKHDELIDVAIDV
jgi:glycosyltransferase involved in cell wall biosynthesis